MARVREMRDGHAYEADFATRMKGHGVWADLLRQRFKYPGELRAVGDVLHDQLFYMRRVGFDAYALKGDKNAVYAIEHGFSVFGDAYQTSSDQPQPHFRRHPA